MDSMLEKYKDLLSDYNETVPEQDRIIIPEIVLSADQTRAMELFKSKKNLVITSSAGCGKSLIIKEIYKYTKAQNYYNNIYITSTTGVSAYSINGITINSYSGIGTGEHSISSIITKVKKNKTTLERIRTTDILVIDEVSMMSAEIFEKLNTLFQTLRGSRKLFGGIQLILSFDILQLQPVFKDYTRDTRLIIQSEIFKKYFNNTKGNLIILQKSYRQENDVNFKNILNDIRVGKVTDTALILLEKRNLKHHTVSEDLVELVPTNKQANDINDEKLSKLTGSLKTFTATIKKSNVNPDLEFILERELITQLKSKNAFNLQIKVGAKVMLIKNLDVSSGLVNGSTGTIKSISNNEISVEFENGLTHFIKKEEFKLEIDNASVIATQYPLILAYGISIHKSQSLTLTNAILDLDRCFCVHQIYVALSRLTSLDGMYIRSFDPKKIKVDQNCIQWINDNK
jgi:ATP-dependent DNA helicase PIF1